MRLEAIDDAVRALKEAVDAALAGEDSEEIIDID